MAQLPAGPVGARKGRTGLPMAVGLLLILALGAGLRLSQVPAKVLSGDEVYSALHISGSSLARVKSELADGHVHPVHAWQTQLRHRPGSQAMDTTLALAREAPEHPPLYYLAARGWQRQFAADPTDLRLLSALFGIALIPAIALLAWELWQTTAAVLMSAALVSLCPLDVLYAQDLREYSLWATLIALLGWLLLRAFRTGLPRDWMLYGAGLTALLYTDLLSLGLLAAFSLLPLVPDWRQSRRALLLTHAGALIAFSPWMAVAVHGQYLQRGSSFWSVSSLPLPLLSWNWGLNLTRLWLDLDPGGRLISGVEPLQLGLRALAVVTAVLGTGLAWNWILRQPDRRPAALLLALLLGSVLPLIVADLLLGGSRSTVPRYPQPGYLAVQLAVAGALAHLWLQRRQLALLLTALVLLLSLRSSLEALASPTWWSKLGNIDQAQIATAVNRWPRPLLISEDYLPRLLALSTQLRDDADLQILPAGGLTSAILSQDRPLLLYRPSPAWLIRLQTHLGGLGVTPTLRQLVRTPSRYPYLPDVDAHTRLWLVQLSAEDGPDANPAEPVFVPGPRQDRR